MPCLAIRKRSASMTSLAMQPLKAAGAEAALISPAWILEIFLEIFSEISLAAAVEAEEGAAVP